MSLRLAFVQQATQPGANRSALCAEFGISRPTGYKWLARYQAEGVAGLVERSRRPQARPRQTTAATAARVLALRQAHPSWGGRKLRARLLALEPAAAVPAASTITVLLRRHGQLPPEAPTRDTPPPQRFSHEAPNDRWPMDFKGHVPLSGSPQRCHPVTALDDYSRFALSLLACPHEQQGTVQAALTTLLRTSGLPRRLLCDHGPPWGSAGGPTPWTGLTGWLVRLGIAVSHGRPRHPQTQGKEERFHRTLRAEVLQVPLADLVEAQARFDAWRHCYNHERPHEALGLAVPASRYVPSARPFPETVPPLVYEPSWAVRRVQQDGWISWQGRLYHVGGAFVGQPVGLRPTEEAHHWAVYFADHCIASLDTDAHRAYPVSRRPVQQRPVVNHVPEHR